ncbi:Os05g0571800, partial [Oryza sativa Japonica Group]
DGLNFASPSGQRTPALHLALVRPPPRASWEVRRRDRRCARPPCPFAVTGGTWRRPAAGPDGAVVQAGGRTARAQPVEEAALLLPRRTSRFRRPRLHNGFQRPSPHPEPALVSRPLHRRREVTPSPSFVQCRSHWW